MQDNDILNDEDYEADDDAAFITLTDDEDKEIPFEVLDYFNYENKDYVVLLPYEESDEDVVILEVKHTGEDEESDEYISVEDEKTLIAVFEEFKTRNADEFDFEE